MFKKLITDYLNASENHWINSKEDKLRQSVSLLQEKIRKIDFPRGIEKSFSVSCNYGEGCRSSSCHLSFRSCKAPEGGWVWGSKTVKLCEDTFSSQQWQKIWHRSLHTSSSGHAGDRTVRRTGTCLHIHLNRNVLAYSLSPLPFSFMACSDPLS